MSSTDDHRAEWDRVVAVLREHRFAWKGCKCKNWRPVSEKPQDVRSEFDEHLADMITEK